MESAVHHELTRATYKILRAHEFTRSSSAATDVIVHLVSRFLELVATSSGEYTQLAGRSTVNVFDCMNALDEMGWDLEETLRFVGDGGSWSRRGLYRLNRWQRHRLNGRERVRWLWKRSSSFVSGNYSPWIRTFRWVQKGWSAWDGAVVLKVDREVG